MGLRVEHTDVVWGGASKPMVNTRSLGAGWATVGRKQVCFSPRPVAGGRSLGVYRFAFRPGARFCWKAAADWTSLGSECDRREEKKKNRKSEWIGGIWMPAHFWRGVSADSVAKPFLSRNLFFYLLFFLWSNFSKYVNKCVCFPERGFSNKFCGKRYCRAHFPRRNSSRNASKKIIYIYIHA